VKYIGIRAVCALLLALVAPCIAWAAEVTLLSQEDGNARPAIVLIKGKIDQGDEVKFGTTIGTIQSATVFFEGPGGSLGAAISIGLTIRKRKFETAIADGATCVSACALAWLGGSPHRIGEYAHIGTSSSAYRIYYVDRRDQAERYREALIGRNAFVDPSVVEADEFRTRWITECQKSLDDLRRLEAEDRGFRVDQSEKERIRTSAAAQRHKFYRMSNCLQVAHLLKIALPPKDHPDYAWLLKVKNHPLWLPPDEVPACIRLRAKAQVLARPFVATGEGPHWRFIAAMKAASNYRVCAARGKSAQLLPVAPPFDFAPRPIPPASPNPMPLTPADPKAACKWYEKARELGAVVLGCQCQRF
jgi:hypothetical protein